MDRRELALKLLRQRGVDTRDVPPTSEEWKTMFWAKYRRKAHHYTDAEIDAEIEKLRR
jgi:hypothetical protein